MGLAYFQEKKHGSAVEQLNADGLMVVTTPVC